MIKYFRGLCAVLLLISLNACGAYKHVEETPDALEFAKIELINIDDGMRIYRDSTALKAFPSTGEISNYKDLSKVLAPFIKLPPDGQQHWTFVAYQSPAPNMYFLHVKVNNIEQRPLTMRSGGDMVTSRSVPPGD